MGLLLTLMLSKFFYMASLSSYYTFYLMGHFGVSTRTAQICLALYLAAVAAGTLLGGRIGDQIGRKAVIWVSILGVLPFSLLLPHMSLVGTVVLTIPIGLLLASAFPAILVFAQDLMPGRVGTVAGLMFGLAFGFGGLGAATLGVLADRTSIDYVFGLCAYLPAIGILAAFLPNLSSNTQVAR
jgi:FSR family fosmidomycin resistance protein-like MFS transporter